jgi:hypothetical protein
MKTLIVLLAALLSLGAYFSDSKPEAESNEPNCPSVTCKRHSPFRRPRPRGGEWPISPRPSTGKYDYDCEMDSVPRGKDQTEPAAAPR